MISGEVKNQQNQQEKASKLSLRDTCESFALWKEVWSVITPVTYLRLAWMAVVKVYSINNMVPWRCNGLYLRGVCLPAWTGLEVESDLDRRFKAKCFEA